MFYNNGYQQPMYGYQQPQQQMYQQSRMDFLQSMQPQQGGLQARPVASREEAVASTVFPCSPVIFVNHADNEAYYKAVDPVTNIVEFVDYIKKPQEQPSTPQYATIADIDALRAELAEMRGMISTSTRRAKGADAE